MTRLTIELNFHQAQEQAKALEEQAARVRLMANRTLPDLMRELNADWKGEAAEAYLQKLQRLQEKLLRQADAVQKAAETLRRGAKRMYDAEMTALRLAEERKASLT